MIYYDVFKTEFRFFWLRCKLDEFPALNQWSHSNPVINQICILLKKNKTNIM